MMKIKIIKISLDPATRTSHCHKNKQTKPLRIQEFSVVISFYQNAFCHDVRVGRGNNRFNKLKKDLYQIHQVENQMVEY